MNFDIFNFHPSIMEGIHASGYSTPTPTQLQVIPAIIQGYDMMGLVETGKSKTAAFVLPILQRLQGTFKRNVRALIISPTRELAEQTREVIIELGRKTGLQSISIYEGVSMEHQINELRHGIEIVVACPDRLLNHLWRGTINLADLEILVIDEADKMLDMGFLPDLRNILACILNKRQTLLFSTTMPTDIQCLADKILKDPVTMQTGQITTIRKEPKVLHRIERPSKTMLLKEILSKSRTDPVLVFTRTKYHAERLAWQLVEAGYKVISLQGNLSPNTMPSALTVFSNGTIIILVVTDSVKRGIDVSNISRVINEGVRKSSHEYIYRIGRTGLVDRNGNAISLVTNADMSKINVLEQLLEAPLQLLKLNINNFNKYSDKEISFSKKL